MRRFTLPFLALLLLTLLCACGSTPSASISTNSPTQAPATTVPTAPPTPQVAYAGKSALEIIQALKAKGLPIGETFNYTADNDLNHLLGRPGQYTGKAEFKDTRISSTDTGANISVSDGGSVEVFATTADAQRRFAYLQ